jgi:DNA-binding CsgD family transcriptional regulator
MKDLSKSEREIVFLLSQDKSAGEIADIRFRSLFTIQRQISTAKKKLQVNTSHGLTAKFVRMSLIVILIALILYLINPHRTRLTQIPNQYTNTKIQLS